MDICIRGPAFRAIKQGNLKRRACFDVLLANNYNRVLRSIFYRSLHFGPQRLEKATS